MRAKMTFRARLVALFAILWLASGLVTLAANVGPAMVTNNLADLNSAASARQNIQVSTNVATLSAMANLDHTKDTIVYLTDAIRFGTFIWTSANVSTQVTNDPQKCAYNPPTSDTSGATGAYVRQYQPGQIYAAWCGVKAGLPVITNTTGLQAIADYSQTVEKSATIYLPAGTIDFSQISLPQYHNMQWQGNGALSCGLTGPTILRSSSTQAILAHGMSGSSWNGICFEMTGSATDFIDLSFDGVHQPEGDSIDFSFDSFANLSSNASSYMVNIDGTARISFYKDTFQGVGSGLHGEDPSGQNFSNDINIISCNFGTQGYAILNAGAAWLITGSVFEGSSLTHQNMIIDARANNVNGVSDLNFISNSSGDATAGNTTGQILIPLGQGLLFEGNSFGAGGANELGVVLGGRANADPSFSGVRGVSIYANYCQWGGTGVCFQFNGSSSDGSWVQGVSAGGNTNTNASLFGGVTASVGSMVSGANYERTGQNAFGNSFAVHGLPTAAGSLASGRVYTNSGVLTVVP